MSEDLLIRSAIANPNIAFIKYWGNRDASLNLPANGSISMNLDGLYTRTKVEFTPELTDDLLTLNGEKIAGPALQRVSSLLERVRRMAGVRTFAEVISENNFPMGAGIASSASAFAALSLAAARAAGLELSEAALSRLARTASGSACRSIPGGFVEWQAGEDDQSSYAFSVAPPEHWALADCVVLVDKGHKPTGSKEGHSFAHSSPIQSARLLDAPRRLDLCRQAILGRDFEALAQVAELDSNLMHAVILTSASPLFYWQPASLAVMQQVVQWRAEGLPVFYTVDAGPNVHVLCLSVYVDQVSRRLCEIPGVHGVLTASPGGPARALESP